MHPLGNPSYLLPPLLATVFGASLFLLVGWRARKSSAHGYFALFLLAITTWSLLIFQMRSSPDTEEAMFWENLVVPTAMASSVALYFFSRSYTQMARGKIIPIAVLLYLVAVPALSSRGLLVQRMELRSYGYAPIFSLLFYPLAVVGYLLIGLALLHLYRAYRASKRYEERNRLLYVIVGILFPVVGTLLDLLPSTYPTSILGNLVLATLTTIAIHRYRLLDISLVIRKGLAYLLTSALVALPYVAAILIATRVLPAAGARPVAYVALLVALALSLQPVWRRVQSAVDRMFFRQRWDSFRSLEEFTRRTHSIADPTKPASELVEMIRSAVQAEGVALLMRSDEGDFAPAAYSGSKEVASLAISQQSPLVRWMDRNPRPLDTQALQLHPQLQMLTDWDKQALERAKATILVPLRMRNHTSGILVLGPKLSDSPYSRDEVALLSMVATQTAVLLDDARLYDAVRAQLEESRRRLEAFHATASNLALQEDPEQALTGLLDTARNQLSAHSGVLTVWDANGRMVRQAISGDGANGDPIAFPQLRAPLPAQLATPSRDSAPLKGLLVVPLAGKGGYKGALCFKNGDEGSAFSQDDQRLAGLFAVVAEALLDNAELYGTVNQEKRTLAAILNSMTEGLAVIEAGGRIAWWNNAMTTFTGIPGQEALGQTFEEVIQSKAPDLGDLSMLERLCNAVATVDETVPEFEIVVARPQSRHLAIKLFLIPADSRQTLVGLLVRDTTRERELEERRNAFISIASHELRTPMTTIVGFSEILLAREVPHAVQHEWLRSIHREGMRLATLVDDMLNISRIQSGKLSLSLAQWPLPMVAHEALAMVRPMTRGHQLALAVPAQIPPVWADKEKLLQVLTNLLTNAIKYSPNGGCITLVAREELEKERVVVSVADQGIGIPSEALGSLFQSFRRVMTPETEFIRGAGLGLYIVKSFVEMMGGKVWVESEVNRGSTFSFSLPTRLHQMAEIAATQGGQREEKSPAG